MLRLLIMLPKSSRYRRERIGPSTRLCGTPWLAIVCEEKLLSTLGHWHLCAKYDLKHLIAVPLIPISCFYDKILWPMMSNAVFRPTRTSMESEPISEAITIPLITLISAVSVLWWTPSHDRNSLNKPFLCRWSHNWFATAFLMILEINRRSDIGL